MTTYRKKLIEVSLPLKAINAESAREKSIRHGHPSTLHLWWARRPLAACRAVLFASLVDDPDSDPQYIKANGKLDEEAAGTKRANLFNLIEELVMWENSNNPSVINSARAEIARCIASRLVETGKLDKKTDIGQGVTAWDIVTKCHCRPADGMYDKKAGRVRFRLETKQLPDADIVNAFLAEHAPPVLDPFAGGGSIPLEAQRLGLRAYASDLNPVPVLINKALIEIPPRFSGQSPVNPVSHESGAATKEKGKQSKKLVEHEWPGGKGLAEDVRYYGQWLRDEAEKRIGTLYPRAQITPQMASDRPELIPYVGQQLTVIAWLWARTINSPNPAFPDTQVPLVSTFMLSMKEGQEAWVDPIVEGNEYRFSVKSGPPKDRLKATSGTKLARANFSCLLSGAPISGDYIKSEAQSGRMGAKLMAIVAEGEKGRVFLAPTAQDETIALEAKPSWKPDVEFFQQALGFRVGNYGMTRWCDLFTNRQLAALSTLSDLVHEVRELVTTDALRAGLSNDKRRLSEFGTGAAAYGDAVATYLAFAVDKSAEGSSTLCTWSPLDTKLHVVSTFGRQALQMTWDYAECNLFADSSGNILRMSELVANVIERQCSMPVIAGESNQCNAERIEVPSSALISTDPPYYDNIGYADLSDYFYVWLRQSLKQIFPNLLTTVAVPKAEELVATPDRHGGKTNAEAFFLNGMTKVMQRFTEVAIPEFPVTIFYAFKQAENEAESGAASTGWETFLEAAIHAGFGISGTWPARTDRAGGFRNQNRNSLASSIVLVCRPRPERASIATRKEFITSLSRELPEALRNLQRGNIAPVDLAQAAIGPGMAVFTRHSKVLENDGSRMSVRTALGLINQSLDEVLAEQEGEFDGDTRWALSWFEQYGMEDGPFGDAETLSKAKNTAINGLVEAGLIVAKSGKVRLVRRDELNNSWSPESDGRLTVWEVTQHLIRRLDQDGESGAADLVAQLHSVAEVARDLSYRLYSTCERKKWAQEAMAYNSLVVAWPEILTLSRQSKPASSGQKQKEMFDD